MGTPTYTPLANLTLGSSAASVTFSSISQAYRDLVLVVNGSLTSPGNLVNMTFNSDTTTTNYSWVYILGDGSSPTSASVNTYQLLVMATNSQVNLSIMDYSASDKHKSSLSRISTADTNVQARAMRWANTAAITSIALTANATTFASGSTFSLFGIAS